MSELKTDVDRDSAAPPCSAELPQEFSQLVGRCEINEVSFTNDDMSMALKFGQQCVAALRTIAMLADTGSDAYKEFAAPYLRMGDKPSGWRVAEEMRQVANDAVESLPLAEDLTIYRRAMESMAKQFVHPKTTALELAKQQLGIS